MSAYNDSNNLKSSIIGQKLDDTKKSIETNNHLILQLSTAKEKLVEELKAEIQLANIANINALEFF